MRALFVPLAFGRTSEGSGHGQNVRASVLKIIVSINMQTRINKRKTHALASFARKIFAAPAPWEDQDEIILNAFQSMNAGDQHLILTGLFDRAGHKVLDRLMLSRE